MIPHRGVRRAGGGTAPHRAPDPAFVRMIEAQGRQPAITIDTSWLLVGHVNETVHVVRARNERGCTPAVADPRQAVELLRRAQRAGEGGQRLFADTTAERGPAVDALLGDDAFLAGNEEAARHIDDQIDVPLRETGLSRRDLVRVPGLYARAPPAPGVPQGAIACSPSVAGGLSLAARDYAAPDPHGPTVDGRDLFREATREALAAGGEVHCATNALRDTSGAVEHGRQRRSRDPVNPFRMIRSGCRNISPLEEPNRMTQAEASKDRQC